MANLETTRESRPSLRTLAAAAPVLSAESEAVLIRDLHAGSQEALRRLLESHLRLVVCIARRFAKNGIAMDDLISEGNLGLVEAARRFDASRGTRFSTYAAWWVRAYVRAFALANRRIVSVPATRNARKLLWRLGRTERDIAQREGRPADRDEVATALGVTVDDVAMVQGALGARDIPVGFSDEGHTFELPDHVPSAEVLTADAEAAYLNQIRVQTALAGLSEREQEIVRRRFLDDDVTTLAVLGAAMGLSRERVRQIEKRAQRKLRTALQRQVA